MSCITPKELEILRPYMSVGESADWYNPTWFLSGNYFITVDDNIEMFELIQHTKDGNVDIFINSDIEKVLEYYKNIILT